PGRLEGLAPPEVAERGVGLPLPPPDRVPLRLPVADEQEAGGGCLGAHGHGTLPGAATRLVRRSAGERRPAPRRRPTDGSAARQAGEGPGPLRVGRPGSRPGAAGVGRRPWPSSGSSPRPARPPV